MYTDRPELAGQYGYPQGQPQGQQYYPRSRNIHKMVSPGWGGSQVRSKGIMKWMEDIPVKVATDRQGDW